VKAGGRAGESVSVIAIKFSFLSPGMTNVRVNAHGIAICAIVLGDEWRTQADEYECGDQEKMG
jgi:hypothetical protein